MSGLGALSILFCFQVKSPRIYMSMHTHICICMHARSARPFTPREQATHCCGLSSGHEHTGKRKKRHENFRIVSLARVTKPSMDSLGTCRLGYGLLTVHTNRFPDCLEEYLDQNFECKVESMFLWFMDRKGEKLAENKGMLLTVTLFNMIQEYVTELQIYWNLQRDVAPS